MISLVELLVEDNLPVPAKDNTPAETPQVDRVESDLDQIRNAFAEALDIDPSEVQVRKSEKKSIEDYADMSMTGDIIISCEKAHQMGGDKVAELLRGFNFLENIEINGQSGRFLSALVFGSSRQHGGGGNMLSYMFGMSGLGDLAGGDVIITTKETENRILPFLAQMGINTDNCRDAFEHYWDGIGGKIISDDELQRIQNQLAAALRPRLGMRQMGALGAGRRQPVAIPRGGFNRNRM